MKRFGILLFVTLLFQSTNLKSQRYWGLSVSNYQGALSVQDNPATFSNKAPKWDANILGYGGRFYTDYAYIQDQSLISALNKNNIYFAVDSIPYNYNPKTDALAYPIPKESGHYDFMLNSTFYGPAFMYKLKNWSFGVFSTFRATGSQGNIITFFDYYNIDTIENFKEFYLQPQHLNGMAWTEIGGNVAYKIELRNEDQVSVGGNLKFLLGHEAFYARTNRPFILQRQNDTVEFSGPDIEFGLASGVSLTSDQYKFGVHGMGVGADLGFEYMKLSENDSRMPYLFKVGASIKDLGFIGYNKNAQVYLFKKDTLLDLPGDFNSGVNNTQEYLNRLSYIFYGDSTAAKVKSKMNMILPTTINLHGDVHLWNFFYGSAFISRSLSSASNQVSVGDYMNLSVRYERKWVEVGTNFSLIDDKWMGWGAYTRLAFITIGTDHLNSLFFKQKKLSGFDAYINIKIFPFGKGNNDEESGTFGQNNRKGNYGCFKF